MKSLLLEAFEGKNSRVPAWFMRQAGRYLPEYQVIKENYSLDQMFSIPELASDITCLPVAILGVDAAILFADILTLPAGMGFNVHFENKGGPVVENPFRNSGDLKALHDVEDLPSLCETISLTCEKLPADTPLIGFAGSPFTVLAYLLEGKTSVQSPHIVKFIIEAPELYHKIMEKLTQNTILYFKMQKECGIKVFQLFDTWAGILRPSDYARWVLPYVQQIFKAVDLPSIYFAKNTAHLLPLANKIPVDFLSVDHSVVIGHNSLLETTKKGLQGNLFNGLLYADEKTLKKEVNDILIGAQKHKRFIFNLSHGVLPDTDVEKLKYVVDVVHDFDWGND